MKVMYYKSPQEEPSVNRPDVTPRSRVTPEGLPLTPSVALRTLVEQLQKFEEFMKQGVVRRGSVVTVYTHFDYPLPPPSRDVRRPIGSPVYDAIADYASKLLARQGLLSATEDNSESRLQRHTQLNRELFAFEHALAFGLGRLFPEASLHLRENAARCALGVAAFWCDRNELVFTTAGLSHPILGERPDDEQGQVLYDFALDAFDAPHNLTYPQSAEFIDLREHVAARINAHLSQRADNTNVAQY